MYWSTYYSVKISAKIATYLINYHFGEKKLAEGGGIAKTAHPLCFFVLILPSRKDYSAKGGGGGVERVGDDDGGRAEDDGAGVAGRRQEQGNC